MKKRTSKRILFIIAMMMLFAISLKSQVFALTSGQINELDNAMKNGGTLNITTSSANSNNTLNINSKNNIFCIEGSKQLETKRDYKVIYKIDINDNQAILYNENGKKLKTVTDNYLCRKMGYILNQPEDRVNMFNQGTSQYSQKQMWYWMYFPNWVTSMGLYSSLSGVNYSSYDSSEYWNLSYYGYIARGKQLNTDATNYANKNSNSDTNPANITKVKTSPKLKTEDSYNVVGPYKLKYEGNVEKITVTDLDGNNITSKVKYGVYNGTKLEFKNSIPNNTKFYICIESSENIKGIGNLYVKVSKEYTNGYSGSIWFLKAVYNGPWKITNPQQVIATTGGTSNKTSYDDITVDINIEFTGELQIKKIDKSTKKNLVGVTFKVYQKDKGWLKVDKDNKLIGYTDDFTKASKMTTLDNGLTPTISNLPISGKYMIVETDLGPYKNLYELGTFRINGGTVEGKIVEDNLTLKPNTTGMTSVTATNNQEYGALQIKKVDEDDKNQTLEGIGFKIYSQTAKNWIKTNKNNEVVDYVSFDEATQFKTGKDGLTAEIKKLKLDAKYDIYETYIPDELSNIYALTQITIPTQTEKVKAKKLIENQEVKSGIKGTEPVVTAVTGTNKQYYGALKIVKKDKDTGENLEGIGFKIYEIGTGWVVADKKTNEVIEYKEKYRDATEFYTDKNGETPIIYKMKLNATYQVFETYLPEELSNIYKLDNINVPNQSEKENAKLLDKNVKVNSGIEEGEIPTVTVEVETNEIAYISLSGYVWQDIKGNYDNKTGQEGNGIYDDIDYKINGVKVALMDKKTGEPVFNGDGIKCEDTTKNIDGKNGYYRFEKIDKDQLANYYVEFTYDGLTYQNVMPQIDYNAKLNEDTGSKASESEEDRNNFNEMFEIITGNGQEINGHKLSYTTLDNGSVILDNARTIDSIIKKGEENSSENVINIGKMGDFTINATTTSADFEIDKRYEELRKQAKAKRELLTEVTNINLGLYERGQTDISLVKDVYSAKLSINGFNHVYEYGNYYKYLEEQRQESDFNVALNWKTNRNNSYTGPIYRSDLNYTSDDNSKELKVSVIYAIDIRNENINTDRSVKVNSIVDYYDKNYTVEKVGTDIDTKTGEVVNTDNKVEIIGEETVNDKYSKITINTSKLGEITGTGENHKTIYVQFNLSKEKIADILDNDPTKAPLDNVVEIESYSTIQNGKPYAAIDTDSIPNNIEVDNTDTYEDDTDKAPSFVLHPEDDRTLSGTVFVDNATSSGSGKVREGNGQYDEGEQVIAGVKVVMTEVDKNGNKVANGKEFETTTGENGEFTITGYTPAYYTISYTWGKDQGYDVKDYKGTIIVDKDRFNQTDWYKTETPRYSDAMDDYNLREAIDTNNTETYNDLTKMISTTPLFGVGIDANGATDTNITTSSKGDEFVRQDSKYLDFGIIERAKQSLEISKTVDTLKITDASGRVLVDAKVNSEGKLEGQIAGVTGGPELGFIKAEIDNEAIQGSTAQIGYKITVTNNGELDYANENFYLYGKDSKDTSNIVKLKATNIYDYLDNDMKLDTTKTETSTETTSNVWKQKVTSDVMKDEATLTEQYFESLLEILQEDTTLTEDITTIDGTVYKAGTTLQAGTKILKESEKIQSETIKKLFQEWYTEIKTSEATTTKNITEEIRKLKLDDRQLYEIAGTAISPKDDPLVYDLYSTSLLSSSDEIRLDNTTEITNVEVYTDNNDTTKLLPGRNIDVTKSTLYDEAEWIAVTPPTGENKDYTMIIISSISAIVILGAGIVFIKKKVLK